MRVIIAGSRGVTRYQDVLDAVEASWFKVTLVVSGRARGVDQLGERWAREHGVPVDPHPVSAEEWRRSRRAGYNRNVRMAKVADALIAVWDGKSPGTKHMIQIARQHGLRVFIHLV